MENYNTEVEWYHITSYCTLYKMCRGLLPRRFPDTHGTFWIFQSYLRYTRQILMRDGSNVAQDLAWRWHWELYSGFDDDAESENGKCKQSFPHRNSYPRSLWWDLITLTSKPQTAATSHYSSLNSQNCGTKYINIRLAQFNVWSRASVISQQVFISKFYSFLISFVKCDYRYSECVKWSLVYCHENW